MGISSRTSWAFQKDHFLRCPFFRICPKLKIELDGKGIYGYCDYQPTFQKKCSIYLIFINNPSYRCKRHANI